MPFRMSRHTARIEIRLLMANRAAQRRMTVTVIPPRDRRLVRAPLLTLPRAIADDPSKIQRVEVPADTGTEQQMRVHHILSSARPAAPDVLYAVPTFRWERNDVAFWDNRCVMHHAVWDYWPHERKGRRVTIKGDRPS